VCVPLILATSTALLEHVNFSIGGFKLDFSLYLLALSLLFYISIDRTAGVFHY
jgi:uncharacterized membrane protein YGL010W